MSFVMEISGQGARLTVEVLGYENPSAQNASDANWLSCNVAIKVLESTVLANFPASFTTYDFIQFRQELSTILSNLRGSATFVTDEEALRLSVEIGSTGVARVDGVACVRGGPETTLSFSFDSDQSYLSQTVNGLEAIVVHFPTR